jgi:uncharacterized protein (DUF983 family)
MSNELQPSYLENNKKHSTRKLEYSFIKREIEKEGYKLLSNEYLNSSSKLIIRCNKGHIYKARWAKFKQGQRCNVCNGSVKHTYTSVKEIIEKEGYKLLSNEYLNAFVKLEVMCPENHTYGVRFNNFISGNARCNICKRKEISKNMSNDIEYVKEIIEKEGYKLLSNEYLNNKKNITIQCGKGHIFDARFDNFLNGNRCPRCGREKTSSKAEKEIQIFISRFVDIISNDRTQILNPKTGFNLELDIWIPSLNKAIEFNGEYWHSLEKTISHDRIKKKQCKEKNIDLLVIQEQDWIENKKHCLLKIKEHINVK